MKPATTKKDKQLVNVWIPNRLVEVINQAVENADTDRAKFIRQAVREKLQREGVKLETEKLETEKPVES